MATSYSAWLLVPYGVQPFAVAEHEVIEYLSEVRPLEVPATPAYCSSMLFWREYIVPFMELGVFAGYGLEEVERQAVVLAYQLKPATPLYYVAIGLQEPPARISVSDDMACDLPNRYEALWQQLAKSCFAKDGIAIPILSIEQLCSTEFRCAMESLENIGSKRHDDGKQALQTVWGFEAKATDDAQEDDGWLCQNQQTQQDGKDKAVLSWLSTHHVLSADDTSSRLAQAQISLDRAIDALKEIEFESDENKQAQRENVLELANDIDDWSLKDDLADMADLDENEVMFERLDEMDAFDELNGDDLEHIDPLMELDDFLDDIDDLDNWDLEDDEYDLDQIDDALAGLDDFDEDVEDSSVFTLNEDIDDAEDDRDDFDNLGVE